MSQVNVILSSKSIKIEPVVITDDSMPIAHAYGSVSDIQPLKRNDEWILVVSFSDPDKSSINLKLSNIANQPTWTDDQAGALQAYNDIAVNFRSATGGSVVISEGWQRPSDWLTEPSLQKSDNTFKGLYAVYPDKLNEIDVYVGGDSTSTIDFGQGAVLTGVSGSFYYKYNYETLTSDVILDELGNPYKQVWVTITNDNPGGQWIIIPDSLFWKYYAMQWLEIYLYADFTMEFRIAYSQNMPFLRTLKIDANVTDSSGSKKTGSIKNSDFGTTISNSSSWYFRGINLDPEQATKAYSTVVNPYFTIAQYMFYESRTQRYELIDLPNVTNAYQMIYDNRELEYIGKINLPNATEVTQLVVHCKNLREVKEIYTPLATSLQSSLQGATLLESVEFTACQNVTNAVALFASVECLTHCRLVGLRYSVSLYGQSLSATECNILMDSLGVADNSETQQELNLAANRGAGTCDTSIATSKGWSVVIV